MLEVQIRVHRWVVLLCECKLNFVLVLFTCSIFQSVPVIISARIVQIWLWENHYALLLRIWQDYSLPSAFSPNFVPPGRWITRHWFPHCMQLVQAGCVFLLAPYVPRVYYYIYAYDSLIHPLFNSSYCMNYSVTTVNLILCGYIVCSFHSEDWESGPSECPESLRTWVNFYKAVRTVSLHSCT